MPINALVNSVTASVDPSFIVRSLVMVNSDPAASLVSADTLDTVIVDSVTVAMMYVSLLLTVPVTIIVSPAMNPRSIKLIMFTLLLVIVLVAAVKLIIVDCALANDCATTP